MDPVRNSRGASNPTRITLEPNPAAEQRPIISNGVDRWEQVDGAIDRVEQTLIVTFLGFMILLAFLQIVLRNFFATGLDWGDSLLRNLVLWIGFIGATLATREGKHINIDVVSRWLPSLGKNVVTLLIHLFSFSICFLLTYATLKFIKNEAQMGNKTFLNLPIWIPELILPLTFGLMTFRFGLRSLKNLSEMKKGNHIPDLEKEA
jgi:TRAP-type C4-dicarboxylate transport system permease small subunit